MVGDATIILLAVLFLAVLVATPIATLVLWLRLGALRRQVARLEAALAGPRGTVPSPQPEAVPEPALVEEPQEPVPVERTLSIPRVRRTPPGPRPSRLGALVAWLRGNWAFTLSALSLALAGVFFVQYGIEKGLLPPPARVAAAILFGLGLVAAGEWIRRRGGEGAEAAALYLPSVFSAAGIVSVYAGLVAGRLLYGLYGPGVTLAGLVATTLGAVVLGWRHGPVLVAMGLIGAGAAPLLVGGGTGPTAILYPYYLMVAFLGLAVDAFRRWGWVSVLALAVGLSGALLMRLGGAGHESWLLALAGFVLLAVVVPGRAPVPETAGPATTERLLGAPRAAFPVRLALGAVIAALAAGWLTFDGIWSFGLLAALSVGLALGTLRAPGLGDLAILPAAVFLARLWLEGPMVRDFAGQAIGVRPPETTPPVTVTLLLAMAGAMTAALAIRARGALLRPLALAAVLTAPLAAAILEFRWSPAPVLGDLRWALHVMAVAAGAAWLATRWAPLADRRPMAWAVLATLASVALAMFLLLDAAALTLAFAALALAAAWLDRRLSLVEMGWFLQAAVAAISYRLVVDPGLDWARQAPLPLVLSAFLGTIAAILAARQVLPEPRRLERAAAEAAGLAWAAILADVLLLRRFAPDGWPGLAGSHWLLALQALPWLAVAAAQLWRGTGDGWAARLRLGVAALAGLLAAVPLVLAATVANPLLSGEPVLGPPVLDTLALAYGLPGALLLLGARGLPALGRLRRVLGGAGLALAALWLALEIRRLWHGPRIDGPFVLEGELYSYTLALLVAGAALLWLAVLRRSEGLRRAAMLVIGLTVAKVFMWDAAGLAGLVRVLSFACLGLVLAGMAWLNALVRRAMAQGRT